MQLKRKGDRHDDVTTSKNLVGLQAKQYQYCELVDVFQAIGEKVRYSF